MATHYRPSYPFGLENPWATDDPNVRNDSGWVEWEYAPDTSHIHSFKYFDTRDPRNQFMRKFPGVLGKGRSELYVCFKDERRGGVSPTYVYFFDDPAAGESILNKLRDSPHPYGWVLYPLVILTGVPYTRL